MSDTSAAITFNEATPFPQGFRGAGVACGIKRSGKRDLTLITCDRPAAAAGAYTTNLVQAASVRHNRSITPSDNVRAVVINSGNANACTGQQGEDDTARMAQLAAETIGCQPHNVLVLSTGIIGELLPMECIERGIKEAAVILDDSEDAVEAAARGILTTDTTPKFFASELTVNERGFRTVGIAKGSGMIGPRMATMLAVIVTDAPLAAADAQAALSEAVHQSFNCISVEGHMSTSDTALMLASGAGSGEALSVSDLGRFNQHLTSLCQRLAKAIPADGEGATHLVTIEVNGCRTRDDADQIAKTVANSPLVKTAIAGHDPNWGRIVSAAGYANIKFDPAQLTLYLNGTLLFEIGTPAKFDPAAVSRSMAENRETSIVLSLREGTASATHWTCDLTTQYVHINADYHT